MSACAPTYTSNKTSFINILNILKMLIHIELHTHTHTQYSIQHKYKNFEYYIPKYNLIYIVSKMLIFINIKKNV